MSADVSKIKKSVQCNIIFIFEALPENMITSVRMWLFLKILLISKKPAFFFFFRKKGCLHMPNCAEIFHTTNVYYKV